MNILFLDIETTPNLAYVWGKFEQNVIDYEKEWEILSIAWRWIDNKEIFCKGLIDFRNEKELIVFIHKLFKEADAIVAHNGDQFDIKKIRARFIFHGLKPPKITTSIDTRKIARRYFAFNSNSLNDLGVHLGLGKKVKHEGFPLWKACMIGDRKAWKRMKAYNAQDVKLLYKIYKKFLPWIETHPSVSLYLDQKGCNKCGSMHVKKSGIRANHSGIRQQMQCKRCGGWYLTRFRKEK